MRIRTQLVVAAFVLAVIPLAAIVTWSYHSSRRALESAYKREADALTKQMDRRLANIRAELDRRVQFVGALPLPQGGAGSDAGSLMTVMGDTARFVDALDFEPVRAAIEPQVQAAEAMRLAAEDARKSAGRSKNDLPSKSEKTLKVVVENVPLAEDVPDPVIGAPDPHPAPAPPAPTEAVVIEIPPMPEFPRYVMSEEQKELIGEIGRVGSKLGDPALDNDERADLEAELRAMEKELRRVAADDREEFDVRLRESRQALRERQEVMRHRVTGHRRPVERALPVPVTPKVASTPRVEPPGMAVPAIAAPVAPKVKVREATPTDVAQAAATARKSDLILGRNFKVPVRQEGAVVGQLTARISSEEVIRRVLGSAADDRSEIPFALDREGTLYTRNAEERARVEKLGVAERLRKGERANASEGWIVSTSTDPQSGLRIGVARPVGENLDDLRRAAGQNFMIGMGLIAFALIGIVPLSNHLTRDVKLVTEGADRIAHGDLMTRLPVKTNNELGQLARAFNQMAEDLSVNQQKLLEQERTRKEQELQQALMAVEYERKSVELEDARRFQLSMLPKELPAHPSFDVGVFIRTATEVGGDYYDFHLDGDVLSVTIGDATGHGAKAGTMVTVVKTLFAGYSVDTQPNDFLGDAAEKIKKMDLGRMAMALSLARFDRRTLTLASAGMPPVLVHRAASGKVDEIAIGATPLGTLGTEYVQQSAALDRGDTVLLLTDGFPELMNDAGHQLGYGAALDAFADAARASDAAGVIASLADAARRWHGDAPPNDDVTFVVVRVV